MKHSDLLYLGAAVWLAPYLGRWRAFGLALAYMVGGFLLHMRGL